MHNCMPIDFWAETTYRLPIKTSRQEAHKLYKKIEVLGKMQEAVGLNLKLQLKKSCRSLFFIFRLL